MALLELYLAQGAPATFVQDRVTLKTIGRIPGRLRACSATTR